MDNTTFMEKQKEIIKKREAEKKGKRRKAKEEEMYMKKEIKHFFEENKELIINNTIAAFMNDLDNDLLPPYKVEHKLNTTLYFGCSRNKYNNFLECMIRDELQRNAKAIGSFEVVTSINEKENGYYTGYQWIKTGGVHRVMYICIYLEF